MTLLLTFAVGVVGRYVHDVDVIWCAAAVIAVDVCVGVDNGCGRVVIVIMGCGVGVDVAVGDVGDVGFPVFGRL